MKRYIVGLLVVFYSAGTWAQGKVIKGEIIEMPDKSDSLYFIHTNDLDNKYYQEGISSSLMNSNHYLLINNVIYPQLYRVVFASDKKKGLLMRDGIYFIDRNTSIIQTDYLDDSHSNTNSISELEYKNQFIPFIIKEKTSPDNSASFDRLIEDQNQQSDTLVNKYVHKNPDSYVALWWLISRFNLYGQSIIRQNTLAVFSDKIKSQTLWQILQKDFKESRLNVGLKFPEINVKSLDLKQTKLSFPPAKFTLVDYWFCRCRPCLDTIPVLKQLYQSYKDKGFNIVSISVDMTSNILLWQQRIKQHGLIWPQYLEENNFIDNELKIKLYPTFILLDSEGKVIWRDFDLHELDGFLRIKLNPTFETKQIQYNH